MPTSNPAITCPGWTYLVADGDEFLLTLPQACQTIYVAIGLDANTPPAGELGHALQAGEDGINRALIGPGPVFARCVDPRASVTLALNAWTPD